MVDTELLPAGIKVPKRYAKTIHNRRLFIAGAQDALAGRPLPEQEDFARQQGTAAWVAYALGHQAGRRWQAQQGWLLARPPRGLAPAPVSERARTERGF